MTVNEISWIEHHRLPRTVAPAPWPPSDQPAGTEPRGEIDCDALRQALSTLPSVAESAFDD